MQEEEQDRIIQEATDKHGHVEAFAFDDGAVLIVAKPAGTAHLEYKRFSEAVLKREGVGDAQEDMVVACAVVPDQVTARALLRKWPAATPEIAKAVQNLMDGGVRRLGKAQKKPSETT